MSDNQAAAPSESSFDDPSSTEDFLALESEPKDGAMDEIFESDPHSPEKRETVDRWMSPR
ncbi:hypothetical protein MMC28_008073 [Mycoblastus sanguinarius]|nr:hypothetical protein [Mycoblastus sanguinarius]